jgi:hypothetical protein
MKTFGWIVLGILVLGALTIFGKVFGVFDKVTDPDHIIASYEQYEEIYSTCNKICDDIRVLKNSDVEETSGFSKGERIIAYENNINRWIRDYNAKSRMITKNLWKSPNLPYQLKRSDFNCKSDEELIN